MVDLGLTPRSALVGLLRTGHRGRAGTVGVTMAERSGLDIVTVAAHRGQGTAVAAAVREAFGLDLPVTPRRIGNGRLAFLWAGDARWTAVSESGDDRLEMRLRDRLGGMAAITGQSDGRVVLRISGPSARDVLGKAVAIDLHPRVFRPGDVALTPAFHIAVQIWPVDDAPTYDLSVARSTAGSLAAWLVAAAEEYGVEAEVVGEPARAAGSRIAQCPGR